MARCSIRSKQNGTIRLHEERQQSFSRHSCTYTYWLMVPVTMKMSLSVFADSGFRLKKIRCITSIMHPERTFFEISCIVLVPKLTIRGCDLAITYLPLIFLPILSICHPVIPLEGESKTSLHDHVTSYTESRFQAPFSVYSVTFPSIRSMTGNNHTSKLIQTQAIWELLNCFLLFQNKKKWYKGHLTQSFLDQYFRDWQTVNEKFLCDIFQHMEFKNSQCYRCIHVDSCS